MYKTVRHGDASLQYTILPQVDQLYVNEMSSISGPMSGSPMKGVHQCPLKERFRITTARTVCWTLLIVAMFISCAIGAYLIDEMVNRRCAVKTFKAATLLTNGYSKTDKTRDNKDEIQAKDDSVTPINSTTTTTTTTTMANPSSTLHDSTILSDKTTSSLSGRIGTFSSTVSEEEPSNFEFPMSELVSPSTAETHLTSLFPSTETEKITSSPSSVSPSADAAGSSVAEESPDSRASILSAAPTNSIVNILAKLKMLKIPRVTLKLTRITDTIPQMYLKTGIASYKKGKITTSVLAQGLTLEGLIFKTPDGTINPWRENKWPFEQEEIDTFHGKRTTARDLRSLAMIVVVVLLFVLLVMALRVIRTEIESLHNFAETQTENPDEAHSTLLAQTQDPEDKE